MLFIFESRVASAFWMKEMRFPLDFVWISRDCEVVDITREVPAPAPGTTDAELKLYASVVTSAYVFEINAGEAAAHGIAFGAAVRFSGVPAELGATCG